MADQGNKLIKKALEETGLPWDISPGRRHLHVRLAGKLVGIMPRGSGNESGRAVLNLRSQIRRAAKEVTDGCSS